MLGGVPNARLLLVDDEDNLRSMLEAALRHSGFEVHPVADGRSAIEAVPTVRPDLIVLDVMLPDLDGCCSSPPVTPPRTRCAA
jgi:two-component system OmpR family response regulator